MRTMLPSRRGRSRRRLLSRLRGTKVRLFTLNERVYLGFGISLMSFVAAKGTSSIQIPLRCIKVYHDRWEHRGCTRRWDQEVRFLNLSAAVYAC